MLPVAIISGLFTATIVGATSRLAALASQASIPPEAWFMYFYVVVYRIKQVLDDLVYYERMQHHAVTKGEPAYAFLTWVLWIVAGITVAWSQAFFFLMALIALLGLPWISAALRNVKTAPLKAIPEGIEPALSRWWKFNLIPLVVGGVYFVLMTLRYTPDWSRPSLWWLGPAVMLGGLSLDIASDWRFMFRLGESAEAT